MRLINTLNYQLEEHIRAPPYAILSHTWHDQQEVLYAEYKDGRSKHKTGYRKIELVCTQARLDGLIYAWIDTICIDKSSSAELSEAINSMYSWYKWADICYVYLDDVEEIADLAYCRWITRGWTLQELIAPKNVQFFNRSWRNLGTKGSLLEDLVRLTRIDQAILVDSVPLSDISAAGRMLWAASRETTRVEDMAYCLLGIFGVQMPLLYGEGTDAFKRLQVEILRRTGDVSILVFNRGLCEFGYNFFHASSPRQFAHHPRVINEGVNDYCELSTSGVKLYLKIWVNSKGWLCGVLPCRFEYNTKDCIALPIMRGESTGSVLRFHLTTDRIELVPYRQVRELPLQKVILSNKVQNHILRDHKPERSRSREVCRLDADSLLSHGFQVIYGKSEMGLESWNNDTLTSEVLWGRKIVMTQKFGFLHQSHFEAFIITFMITKLLTSKGRRIFLRLDTKPVMIDCVDWFQQNGLIGTVTTTPTSSESEAWIQNINDKPDICFVYEESHDLVSGRELDELRLINRIAPQRLMSGNCFTAISVELNRVEDVRGWAIVIEPAFEDANGEYRNLDGGHVKVKGTAAQDHFA